MEETKALCKHFGFNQVSHREQFREVINNHEIRTTTNKISLKHLLPFKIHKSKFFSIKSCLSMIKLIFNTYTNKSDQKWV